MSLVYSLFRTQSEVTMIQTTTFLFLLSSFSIFGLKINIGSLFYFIYIFYSLTGFLRSSLTTAIIGIKNRNLLRKILKNFFFRRNFDFLKKISLKKLLQDFNFSLLFSIVILILEKYFPLLKAYEHNTEVSKTRDKLSIILLKTTPLMLALFSLPFLFWRKKGGK